MCFKQVKEHSIWTMEGQSSVECQNSADEIDGNADHILKSSEQSSSEEPIRVQTCHYDVCGNYSCLCEICTDERERSSMKSRITRLKTENERFKTSAICRNCKINSVQILTLPCSHVVCCEKCADILVNCPLCNDRILGTVRIYMS